MKTSYSEIITRLKNLLEDDQYFDFSNRILDALKKERIVLKTVHVPLDCNPYRTYSIRHKIQQKVTGERAVGFEKLLPNLKTNKLDTVIDSVTTDKSTFKIFSGTDQKLLGILKVPWTNVSTSLNFRDRILEQGHADHGFLLENGKLIEEW
jgi:hypothetical protein